MCCLHLWGRTLILKTEVAVSAAVLAPIYQTTWHHTSQGSNHQIFLFLLTSKTHTCTSIKHNLVFYLQVSYKIMHHSSYILFITIVYKHKIVTGTHVLTDWQLFINQEYVLCLLNIIIKLAHQYYYIKNMCEFFQYYQLITITNLTDNISIYPSNNFGLDMVQAVSCMGLIPGYSMLNLWSKKWHSSMYFSLSL